ncbi:hypothetical protein [Lacticaseibacillus suibinensis]|uniref:hypothetical protein n=1 Tax=Lacticaseibacillus suibinensis TaxID=2486011 RepID=UPI00194073B3|nr:hypothetical protein [Lacticaseibacillus suibinensis]
MLSPGVKVFMYMLTMSGSPETIDDPVWHDRYRLEPLRLIPQLLNRSLIEPVPAKAGQAFELTPKGQAALADIDNWLWVHEYYLADVIDFAHVRDHWWSHPKVDYGVLERLLQDAKVRYGDDPAYMAILLRHQLRLEYDTHHNDAAAHTLMALIDQDLDPQPDGAVLDYDTTWAKITEFEKSTLKTLLSRLNWTLTDFEMAFSNWLDTQPRRLRLFTRFELMTIVMYEIGNDKLKLRALYAQASTRTNCPPAVVGDSVFNG